jgi:hypothetical protein
MAFKLVSLAPSKSNRFQIAHAGLIRYLNLRSTSNPTAFVPARVPAIATVLANATWWMTAPVREILADIGLAIFAFDDLVDEQDIDVDDLEFRCEQLLEHALEAGCPEVAFDPTADLLRSVSERLATAPLAAEFSRDWSESLCSCFRAIVGSRRTATQMQEGRVPSFDAYLDMGRDSVGIVPVCIAVAMLDGDARVVEHRDAFLAAVNHAAVAVRLANDLRTIHRERGEQTVNALMLDGVDIETLEALARSERAAASRILADIDCGWPGLFVQAFTDSLLALYGSGDFREHEKVAC